ncbi:chloride channel protein [Parvularcula dongshanensis]|uniref:CIC family chloride channel protein n=1 Tax=Parvularcula dongshanensis TaxID=1173995 RepID=A0A840I5E0_9PROT|nr:chloride channel protein [Parvularcula dongshanensis]MBB4660007.1 CIC family chloride channel protein [Parvularcula dongshanensis]
MATPVLRIRLWLRHARQRALTVTSWKVWVLASVLGVVTAYAVLGFIMSVEYLTSLSYGEGTASLARGARGLDPARAFIVPVIGGFLVGGLLWLAHRIGVLATVRCQGVAEVIEARASPPGTVSVAAGAVNTLATALALGTGASAGREGPSVFIGGALATYLTDRFGLSSREARTLIGCGAAAAVSAAFNAPIAGVLFALEVVLSNYALSVFGPVVLASVLAALINRAQLGDLHRFVIPDYGLASAYDVPLGAILGVICGAVAWTFLQLAAKGRRIARGLISRRRVEPALLPPIAGVGMGVVALFLPEALGVGYEATSQAIAGQYTLTLLTILLVAKILATVLCLSCRFGTGVFSGGIYLGAMSGAAFGLCLNLAFGPAVANPTFYALVGMGAVSGAIIGAPISTTLIVFELTGDYGMTAALMLAVGVASLIVQVFFGSSWFHYQLNQRGYDLSDGPQGVILQTIRVRDVMRSMPESAAPLEEGAPRLLASQGLGEALARMQDLDLDGMPVVADVDDDRIVGTLTQIRALRTYNKALIESHIEHHR